MLALGIMIFVALACSWNKNTGGNTSAPVNSNASPANSSNSNAGASAPKTTESGSGALENVHLARDDGRGRAGETVTGFKPTDNPLYCVVQLREPKDGTKVKAEWIVVNAGGERDTKFLEKEFKTTGEMDVVTFTAKLPREWPDGDYKVNVFVNDKLEKSLDFQIK